MEEASKLLAGLAGSLRQCREVAGECEKHGASVALLHPRSSLKEWYCAECTVEARQAEDRATWLRERAQTLNRIACLPERYQGIRFEAKTPEQKRVRVTVRAFRDSLTAERRWSTLILVGLTGTGKTLLACELAQSLIDNLSMSVRYCTANQMIAEIQAAYDIDGKTEESEVARFAQYDLLVLDEIDAIRSSENASLLLTEVVNRRYNAQRPVVAISNQSIDRLAKFVGDRVYSRLQENTLICAHDWPDQRVAG